LKRGRGCRRTTLAVLVVMLAGADTPPEPVSPAPPQPSAVRQIESLAEWIGQAPVRQATADRFRSELDELSKLPEAQLQQVVDDGATSALTRRLAEITLDIQAHPNRHQAMKRYEQSEAELAAAEGRSAPSQTAGNHPPHVLPEHLQPEFRFAWEHYLLQTSWWQGKERAAKALKSLGAVESAVVLGLELRKAIQGFDPQQDVGWRERAIIFLTEARWSACRIKPRSGSLPRRTRSPGKHHPAH
jgi:hypothetical protein